ncbi:helix-turn-helix domain-containing protein [Embleya sp. NPDC005575]|uniref:PucR family transcriptional regulator n=1 Tax=Embleya sp. NPDC005575 TaxID=3156892 RepID=UPI0033A7A7FA
MTVRTAWRNVPRPQLRRFADLAIAEIPDLAQGILRDIRIEYPTLPLVPDESGEPMALVAIRRALVDFVDHLLATDDRRHERLELFEMFGRAEVLQGRSLDSLQAVYRLGVRLAWRRLAEIGQLVEIPPPAMYELAEAGFEYLDGLVAQSVHGYAEAAARQVGERLWAQKRLIKMMLTEYGTEPASALAEHAARIGWLLPEQVAVGVLLRPAPDAVAPAVGRDVLLDMECERPRMILPDPDAAGRPELLRRAMAGWSGAIGPSVPLADAAKSLHWACTALRLMERGQLPDGRVIRCTEHTEALVLLPPEELIEDLARRCLAPLDNCPPAHSRRLAATLLAWLETRGGAPEIAARLGVHAQTVRYRLRRIRELLGEEMDEPDRRFELELVLRARRLREAKAAAHRD